MTRNSLERRKVFLRRLASLPVIAFVAALVLLSAACNNVNLAGKGSGSGTVSLAIGDVLTKSVRSAGEPLRQTLAAGTEYTVKARLSGGHTADTSITVDSGNLAGAALSFEGIPIGVTVRLDLEVRAGNNLVWIGSTVDDHTVVSGENPLSVEVGRVSGVLLWKRNVDSGNHNILTAPYGAYDSPAETKITFGASDSSQGTPFCFDGAGNLYVMPSDDQSLSEVKQYDLQPNGTYEDSNTNISTNGQFNHLAYDSVAGTLYGIGEEAGLYYSKSNGNFEPVQGDTVNTGSCLGLAAHDNVVYTIEPGSEDSDAVQYATVKSYSISIEGSDAGDTAQSTSKDVKEDSFLLPSFCTSNYTGQMIYQDGALYLLLRRFEINDASNASTDNPVVQHYSLGALAKIDPNTLSLDTSFGDKGYLGLSHSSVTFSNREDSGNTFNVTYHGSAAENNTFFGPVGFVAVMPKKLVIADAGFSMTDGGDGKVNLEKKARILTVDLEEKVFDDEPLDAAYFQEGYPEFNSSGYTYINGTN